MKVKDLIQRLLEMSPNQEHEVRITWEGVFQHIDDDSLYWGQNSYGDDIVVIDADDNFYKDRITSGKLIID